MQLLWQNIYSVWEPISDDLLCLTGTYPHQLKPQLSYSSPVHPGITQCDQHFSVCTWESKALEIWHAFNYCGQSLPVRACSSKIHRSTQAKFPQWTIPQTGRMSGMRTLPSQSEGRTQLSMSRPGFEPIQHKEIFFFLSSIAFRTCEFCSCMKMSAVLSSKWL